MPIIDLQYRLRELGRIRMGKKGPKGAPQKLKTWRLTSASRDLLEVAAENYGGTVQVWEDAPNDGEHFELITTSEAIDIIVPPGDTAFSQWMEMWSGGGCKKRCDGKRQVLVDRGCSCPEDHSERMEAAQNGKACKPTTRFNVLLPSIPDVGVWRLESHGYNAALELAAFQQLADVATSQGRMIRARLRIDHRSVKRDGKTQRFTVPIVEISHRVGDMLQALGATVDDISISLPGPVEGRSLPGAPGLPAAAPQWEDESEAGSESPVTSGNEEPSAGASTRKGEEGTLHAHPSPVAPPHESGSGQRGDVPRVGEVRDADPSTSAQQSLGGGDATSSPRATASPSETELDGEAEAESTAPAEASSVEDPEEERQRIDAALDIIDRAYTGQVIKLGDIIRTSSPHFLKHDAGQPVVSPKTFDRLRNLPAEALEQIVDHLKLTERVGA